MRHRMAMMSIAAVVSLFGMILYAVAPVEAADTADFLMERTSADAGASGGRELPAITPDGRYVAYVGRGEGAGIWITDRFAGTTTHLTTGMDFNPAISDDGAFVAFARYGSTRQVNLVDVATKTVTVVSVNSAGTPGDGLSDFPSLSADGRYVAFNSTATNLDTTVGDPGAGGGPTKVYVHDRTTGQTSMVSVNNAGMAAKGNAVKPDITPDGRFVAFASDADNLIDVPVATAALAPGEEEEETEAVQHVYIRDLLNGTTEVVSVDSNEVPGTAISSPLYGPTISMDGRYVAFESLAALVSDDTNNDIDAYVRDRTAGTTVRVSVNAAGQQVDLPDLVVAAAAAAAPEEDTTAPIAPVVGAGPAISADGTAVAFESAAVLTADDFNGVVDPYLRNLVDNTTIRLAVPVAGGSEATGTRIDGHTGDEVPQTNGYDVTISKDGRYVSFVSNGDLAADRPVEESHEELPALTAAAEAEEEASTEPAVFTRTVATPNMNYVVALYQDVLERNPEIGGLDYWTVALDNGTPRSTLVDLLTNSREFLMKLVRGTYEDILGRSPEDAGLQYWTGQLASGMQWEELRISLLGSDEYFLTNGGTNTAFVTALFDDVLDRTPDASGLAYFVAQLDNGASRIGVASSIVRSEEASTAVMIGLYDELLHRAPDPDGLAYWVATIGNGESSLTVMRLILSSPEYYNLAQAGLHIANVAAIFGT